MAKRIILYIIIIGIVLGCKKNACFLPEGKSQEESFEVESFSELEIYGNISVLLIPSVDNRIVLSGSKNLINTVRVNQLGATIEVRDEIGCNFLRGEDERLVKVYHQKIRRLYVESNGEIYSNKAINSNDSLLIFSTDVAANVNIEVDVPVLEVQFKSGTGDIKLRGKTEVLYAYNGDFGFIRAFDMLVDQAYINNNSFGDIQLNCKNDLGLEILSKGNIEYKGSPNIIYERILGRGRSIKVN
jgi:hypothetical protein